MAMRNRKFWRGVSIAATDLIAGGALVAIWSLCLGIPLTGPRGHSFAGLGFFFSGLVVAFVVLMCDD